MPICRERNFAFIHIPKTGGTSIEMLLEVNYPDNLYGPEETEYDGVSFALQHLTPDLLRQLVPDLDDMMKFCFTRHPYQKAVSEFFWLQDDFKHGRIEYSHEKLRIWIRDELSKKDCDHKIDQWDYAKDCDYVFKYVDFADAPSLLRSIGIEVDMGVELPHALMPSYDSDKVASEMPEDICRMIDELYPNDFENLGYERCYTPEPKKELGEGYHIAGDVAYHNGDLTEAKELWGKGAELGNKQCRKNLEWATSLSK